MGYTSRAAAGVGWNTVVKIVMTLLSVVKIMVLARLLSQEDFGVFALVVVALGVIEAFTETGINTTILQSQKDITYYLNTAWVISIVRGLCIAILMICAGFIMAQLYQLPELVLAMGLASVIPVVRGAIHPAIVTLQKELRFFHDSVYRIALLVVEVGVTLLFALWIQSAYALILGLLATAIFEVVYTFLLFHQRPQFAYLPSRAEEIFRNMRQLNPLTILVYLSENLDSAIVGKVIGTAGLGVYQNSYGLTHRLNLQLAKSIFHGTLPVYTKLQSDVARLRRAYLRTILVSLTGLTLLGLPFFLFPQLTIDIFLGAKWESAVPLVRPLILAGLVQSIVTISTGLFIAKKQYSWLQLNLLATTCSMTALIILLGSQVGLVGVAWAVLSSRLIGLPIVLFGIILLMRPTRSSSRQTRASYYH